MRCTIPQGLSLPRAAWLENAILLVIFLYFFTTSADLLNIRLPLFSCKANHFLGLFLFGLVAVMEKKWRCESRLLLAFAFTAVSVGISICFSPLLYRSFVYFCIYLFTFAIYFLLPYNLVMIYGRQKIFQLYKAAFIATGLFAAAQFMASLFGIMLPFVGQVILGRIARGQAMAYEPSYFALYIAAYVMYENALFLYETDRILNRARLKRLSWINALLLVSTSTGAFFAYFIFFAVCFAIQGLSWIRRAKRQITAKLLRLSVVGALFFGMLALSFPAVFLSSFWKFFQVGFMHHHSFVERWMGIERSWRVFLEHPIFGVGLGGSGILVYQQEFCAGRAVDLYQPHKELFEFTDPTNVATELLASLGLFGLLAFGIFFFFYFRPFKQVFSLPHLPKKERSSIYALFVSVLVMLIVLQFNQNLFRSYIWVHLAFCFSYLITLIKEYDQPRLEPHP